MQSCNDASASTINKKTDPFALTHLYNALYCLICEASNESPMTLSDYIMSDEFKIILKCPKHLVSGRRVVYVKGLEHQPTGLKRYDYRSCETTKKKVLTILDIVKHISSHRFEFGTISEVFVLE